MRYMLKKNVNIDRKKKYVQIVNKRRMLNLKSITTNVNVSNLIYAKLHCVKYLRQQITKKTVEKM